MGMVRKKFSVILVVLSALLPRAVGTSQAKMFSKVVMMFGYQSRGYYMDSVIWYDKALCVLQKETVKCKCKNAEHAV